MVLWRASGLVPSKMPGSKTIGFEEQVQTNSGGRKPTDFLTKLRDLRSNTSLRASSYLCVVFSLLPSKDKAGV